MGSEKSSFRFQGLRRARLLLRAAAVPLPTLLCLLAVIHAVCWPQESPPQPTPAARAAAVPAEQPAGPAGLAYKFIPGDRTLYQIVYESNAQADFRALFSDKNGQAPAQASSLVYALSAELRGQWVATVLETDAEHVRAIYQLRDGTVRVQVNGQEQAAQAESVRASLSRGVLLEMSPDGKVLAVTVDPAADKFSRDFALSIFGVTEFVLPGATGSWQSREEDRTGVYSAHYHASTAAPKDQASPGPTPRTIIDKTKLRYFLEKAESTLPGQVPAQKQVIPSGTIQARFDPDQGRLVSLAGTEVQDTIIAGKKVARSSITLRLTRVSGKQLPREELTGPIREAKSLAEKGSRLALYTKVSPQEMQSSIQRTQLGAETLDSLLEQLAAVERLRPKGDQTELYLKFKALIYLHPETCARLGAMVAAAGPESPTFVILARALGAVANVPAQEALIAAIKTRPLDMIAVSNLIPTLAEAPSPTLSAEETVRQLAQSSSDPSISATALLALGTMARGLAQKSPARSNRIVHELLAQATLTQSEDRTHDVVEALGNTQSPEALPVLAGFAKSPAPRLRAAALDAMRFMPAPRADSLLLNALSDSDAVPRLEAAYALGFRKMTPESFAAQKKALLKDDNEKVRAALLSNLWKAHARFPEARALVETASNQDPSEYVRKVATGMLTESP